MQKRNLYVAANERHRVFPPELLNDLSGGSVNEILERCDARERGKCCRLEKLRDTVRREADFEFVWNFYVIRKKSNVFRLQNPKVKQAIN